MRVLYGKGWLEYNEIIRTKNNETERRNPAMGCLKTPENLGKW